MIPSSSNSHEIRYDDPIDQCDCSSGVVSWYNAGVVVELQYELASWPSLAIVYCVVVYSSMSLLDFVVIDSRKKTHLRLMWRERTEVVDEN